ncbi:MAG: hypothetical protein IJS59_06185 [Bacteroidaceae bacterium]|nr:hypothetical protein [Bacteroidaceae bacterium]
MKRLSILILAATALLPLHAQDKVEDFGIFDHLGANISVGTDGIGIELGAPITNYAAMRAGFNFFPKIKVTPTVKYTNDFKNDPTSEYFNQDKLSTRVQGKLNWMNGKVLFDAFPFGAKNSFHITAGLFFGTSEIMAIQNLDPIQRKDHLSGIEIGDYIIHEDAEGIIKANIKVNSIKPYVGVGFGRPVPKKRIGVAMDLGVMFHGKPTVNAFSPDDNEWVPATSSDTGNEDGGAIDIASKIRVWPVLNVRLTGRIF